MENDGGPARKRGLTAFGREARLARILARLREGWAYDEVGREERLTAERVRQIVRKGLEGRPLDEATDHAKLQLARIQPAMRIAGAAVERGDVAAIAPLLKCLDQTCRPLSADRSRSTAESDDEARGKKLFEKLNQRRRMNLRPRSVIAGPTKPGDPRAQESPKTADRWPRRAAPSLRIGRCRRGRGRKRKNALGARRKPLKRLDWNERIQGNQRKSKPRFF